MTKIAVVLPTLDDSNALRRSLQSISQQTLLPDEVIVVANGDLANGVGATVKTWNELAPTPKVLEIGNPPNVARALNAGIQTTMATYVVRMDAGDWSFPQRIESQARIIENERLDLVASDVSAITPEGVRVPKFRGRLPVDNGGISWHLLIQNCIAHPTVIVRRQSIIDAGLYDEDALLEDYDLWLRVIPQWKMRLLNDPLLVYSYQRQSRTREVKLEGSAQLPERLIQAWNAVAGISLSETTASRLLAPGARADDTRQSLDHALQAMAALNELERRAVTELSPASYLGLRQRSAMSRVELLAAVALVNPSHAIRLATTLSAPNMAKMVRTSWKVTRFMLERRLAEYRQQRAPDPSKRG